MTTEDARAANNVENIISRIRIRRSVGSTLSSCRAASTCSHLLSARADARERRRRRAEETRERTRTTAPRVRTATRARASDRRDARRPRRPRPRADLLARGEAKKKKRSAQLDRDAMSPSALRADCASLAAGIESVASGAALTRVDVDDGERRQRRALQLGQVAAHHLDDLGELAGALGAVLLQPLGVGAQAQKSVSS